MAFSLPFFDCVICKPYLADSIASSVIRLVDSIQTYLAFTARTGQKEGRVKRVAVAVMGENGPSLARRLSMRLNRSLSCAMFFLASQKNNHLLPLLLSVWLAS